jgi:uncharacterized OB-fold protein
MTASRPLPDTDDALTAPFWAATRESRLTAQQCTRCAAFRWLPAPICPECLEPGGTCSDLAGTGTVWSYAVYHRAMHPGFADLVPYTVALVELDEGIRMVGTLRDDLTREMEIGERVTAAYETVTPDVTLVRWAPERAASQP